MAEITQEQREQAARVLVGASGLTVTKTKGWFLVFTKEFHDALDTAIAALRRPVPDPETGLAACGCGDKAIRDQINLLIGGKDIPMYSVRCKRFHVSTQDHSRQEDADNDWNMAMGAGMIKK